MAVLHIVWVKFHPELARERIAGHLRALESMPDSIPEITALHIGENFTDRAAGFTHGLIVTLGSRADLQRYIEHEHHARVAGALREDAELLVMDIEA